MLRFGPDDGPVVVVAPPLFEEANRTRAFIVAICRALAELGVASVLPDLPGQGESVALLTSVRLDQLRRAFRDLADLIYDERRHTYSLAIRSGTLLDVDARLFGRWRFAPQTGHDLLRELGRTWQAGKPGRKLGEDWFDDPYDPDAPVEVAGHVIGAALLADLVTGEGWCPKEGHGRTVRLESDTRADRPADRLVGGSPLWRRAEPDTDPALAAMLADDVARWVLACEG